jgi:ELWxxDGT repeat protein
MRTTRLSPVVGATFALAALALAPTASTWASGAEPVHTFVEPGDDGFIDKLGTAGGRVFGSLFIQGDPGRLWTSDGTAAGTRFITDERHGSVYEAGLGGRGHYVRVGDRVFFAASTSDGGSELWSTQGSPETTGLVKDIYRGDCSGGGFSGPCSSQPRSFVAFRGTLYFIAYDPKGARVYRSDGSAAGTVPVTTGISVTGLTKAGGSLYIAGHAGPAKKGGLWRSDGTKTGVHLVKHEVGWAARKGNAPCDTGVKGAPPCDRSTLPHELTAAGNRLFFRARDRETGWELWVSDGTTRGTHRVKDIRPGPDGSRPQQLTRVGKSLYFTVAGDLWKSDGTEAGTKVVRVVSDGAKELTNVAGRVFFAVGPYFDSPPGGHALWVSDGTRGGTRLVATFAIGSGVGSPEDLTAVGTVVCFDANDETAGSQLWCSDGTTQGTWRVTNQFPASREGFVPHSFAAAGNTLYLAGRAGGRAPYGSVLWQYVQ